MPHYILFPRDIALLSLVFQCCMDYNNFILFSHHTPHLHAFRIVPSAQCQFACKQLTNKQTNKSLQQMSDSYSELNGVTKAMEAADLADGVKEENERAPTPTQRNPMSRAPTPEPTPTTDPNPDPIPTRDPDPSIHQNHTQPPGPEPLHLSANFAPPPLYVLTPPAAGCLSPPDKVLRTKETGPRCRRRPGLHGGTRIGKRGKLKGRSRRPTNVRTRTQGSWLMRNPKRKSQKVSQSVLANKPTKTTTTTTTGSLTLTTTISCA